MRLKIVSYSVLGLFLVTGSLALTYYIQTIRQDAVISELASRVNESNSRLETAMDSLDEIERSVQASDKIITALQETLGQVTESDWAISERIEMLERNNVEIRDLLSTRLPDNGCLLDNSCRHTGVPLRAAERGPAGPVRPAAPGPE